MRVTSADIYHVQITQGFNPVILRLLTEDGIEGIGEMGLAYGVGGAGGAQVAKELVEKFVLGQDPRRVETIWHQGFRRTFWGQGGGPVLYGAMSAIDMALWDIKGKAAGLPVCEMLGGPTQDELWVYANGWYGRTMPDGTRDMCVTPEDYAQAAVVAVEKGFNALKFDPFAVNSEGQWDYVKLAVSRQRANLSVERVRAVREAVGPDVEILIECHGNLGVTSAIAIGKRMAELDPFFYEEPVHAMNVASMLKVSQNVPIPIAAGERLYTRYGFRQYIETQALDILQPDIGLAGGITELKKIATYAETYDIHVQPHRYASPITTAASVQLDASITNFIIQEFFPFESEDVCSIVEDPLERKVVDSMLAVPMEPGLGVTLNHDRVDPYRIEHMAV